MATDTLCNIHQRDPEPGNRCPTCKRIRMELTIVRKVASALIKAGYSIDVNDGEDTVLGDSVQVTKIMEVVFSTDEDIFFARRAGQGRSWVRFIYGNSGHDVISDYTTNLEEVLAPVNAYADGLAQVAS